MLPATGRGQHLGHRVGVTQHDPPAHVHYPALDRGLHDLREQQPGRADARWPAPLATAHPLTEGPRDRPDIATQAVHADQHTRATRAGADARGQRVDQLPVAARTEHPAEPEALRAQPWPLLATRAPSPLAAEEKQGVCCAPLLPSPQRGAVCRPSRRSHPPVHAGGRPALPAPDACGLAGSSLQKIAKNQGYVCQVCGETLFNEEELHKHHVVPRAQGGADSDTNLALTHLYCHQQIHSGETEIVPPTAHEPTRRWLRQWLA